MATPLDAVGVARVRNGTPDPDNVHPGGVPSATAVRVHATLHGFERRERELDLPEGAVADDAPRALGIRPELVLVFRGEGAPGAADPTWRPLPGDATLREGDRVRILRVVSGGGA